MPALLEDVRNEIETLCRRYHVRRLEVFGSLVSGGFDPQRSDADFLVEFDDSPGLDRLGAYIGFQDDLISLLGRQVDLVMFSAVRNPIVRADIEAHRQIFYAA